MRLVCFGTPALAAEYLAALAAHHDVAGVVTQPDRRLGRGQKLVTPPLKQAALALGVPVLQPGRLSDPGWREELRAWAADVFVVVAYGHLLPRSLIKMPALASVNVHYSLLPQFRGAAPVQHALLQGLTRTGVTVQYMAVELDAGDIILQQATDIDAQDNAATLTARLTKLGISLVLEALDLIAQGQAVGRPQDQAAATCAPALTKQEGIIDWCRPAQTIVNQVRACFPWPGATSALAGRYLKITRAAVVEGVVSRHEGNCGEIVEIRPVEGFVVQARGGAVLVQELQPAGRRVMAAGEFLRGARLSAGMRLESVAG